MKIFFLFCFFFSRSTYGNSQSAIEIEYHREVLNDDAETFFQTPSVYMPRMVFNDSFALVYFFDHTDNRGIKGKKIGHKIMHHGTFYNFIKGEKLWEVKWSKKEKYLIKDTTAGDVWQFLSNERTILNQICHAALSVKSNGDSVLVWYTKDINFQNGPLFYDNIPGVVLEAFDQNRHQHFLAIKIKTISIKLVSPEEGILLSALEWERIRAVRLKQLNTPD
jgi:GLPGLI family protein